jgi:GTP:adenosylcobinamide-phosphate guanylyltransferase
MIILRRAGRSGSFGCVKELVRKMEIIMAGPESFREQQHNKPLEIKDQEMFNKILEYIPLSGIGRCFVCHEPRKMGSIKKIKEEHALHIITKGNVA